MSEFLALMAFIVGVIMPFGYLLQTFKMVKNKSSKNVSIWAFLFFDFAFVIWLLYGISIQNMTIIASYAVGIVCVTSTVIAYFFYRK